MLMRTTVCPGGRRAARKASHWRQAAALHGGENGVAVRTKTGPGNGRKNGPALMRAILGGRQKAARIGPLGSRGSGPGGALFCTPFLVPPAPAPRWGEGCLLPQDRGVEAGPWPRGGPAYAPTAAPSPHPLPRTAARRPPRRRRGAVHHPGPWLRIYPTRPEMGTVGRQPLFPVHIGDPCRQCPLATELLRRFLSAHRCRGQGPPHLTEAPGSRQSQEPQARGSPHRPPARPSGGAR